MLFYRIVLVGIFEITGYHHYGVIEMMKSVLPVSSISKRFDSSYIVFYLFIPFLNILIRGMNRKQHFLLMVLCISVYTGFATLHFNVVFNYVTWLSVLYIIGSYIRLYPEKWFDSKKLWGWLTILMVLLSWISIILIAYSTLKLRGKISTVYFFVHDSNKLLALTTGISSFMFFKNVNLGYNRFINTVAASSFGVLLIHSHDEIMRRWLWRDVLNNVGFMETQWVYIHAFASVIGIYVICTAIDIVRFNLLEKPFFKWYDKIIAKK